MLTCLDRRLVHGNPILIGVDASRGLHTAPHVAVPKRLSLLTPHTQHSKPFNQQTSFYLPSHKSNTHPIPQSLRSVCCSMICNLADLEISLPLHTMLGPKGMEHRCRLYTGRGCQVLLDIQTHRILKLVFVPQPHVHLCTVFSSTIRLP